jgi:hypothetical protein
MNKKIIVYVLVAVGIALLIALLPMTHCRFR